MISHQSLRWVQFYFAANRRLAQFMTLLSSVWIGLWLGILDKKTLHAIDKRCYDQWAEYHGEAHNRQGLTAWETRAIRRYFGQCQRLLVAGAGGGREVLALSHMGYAVDGFECHPELAAFANRLLQAEGLPATIELVARDECPDAPATYDGVIVGWGAYMLIQGRQKRIAFLRKLRKKAAAGAPLLLSFFPRSSHARRFQINATVGNGLRRLLGRNRIEVGDSLAPNYVHFFTKEELCSELQQAGFALVFYATAEYGHAVAQAWDNMPGAVHRVDPKNRMVMHHE